jgi:hypothetical protein
VFNLVYLAEICVGRFTRCFFSVKLNGDVPLIGFFLVFLEAQSFFLCDLWRRTPVLEYFGKYPRSKPSIFAASRHLGRDHAA